MKSWLIFVGFWLISFSIAAQRYSFISYSTEDGLPQSQVTAITQDNSGYLWVGTLGGLAKFNGKRFTTLTVENGLLNNRITCLQSEKKSLWIGHEGGITLYRNNQFVKWKLPPEWASTAVSDIIRYKGRIIVATNGGGLYIIDGIRLRSMENLIKKHVRFVDQSDILYHQEDDLRVRDLLVHNDLLYVGTRGGLLITADLQNFRHDHRWDQFNISGLTIRNNRIAASTYENGFVEQFSNQSPPKSAVSIDSTLRLRGCMTDRNRRSWLYSAQGVCLVSPVGKVTVFSEKNGLPIENIRVVFEDQFGNIWLGSEGKGLLRFPGLDFVHYSQSDGMSSDLILSVSKDTDGSYWLGTYDKGILHMKTNRTYESLELESSNTVWSTVLNVDCSHWFGTSDGLVRRLPSGKIQTYFSEDGLPGNKITAFYKVNHQVMYVGGENGVSLYRNGKFYKLPIQQASTVRSFALYKGKLYCATDRGLAVVQGGSVVHIKQVKQPLFSIYADDEIGLWMGNESGLYEFKNEQLSTFSLAQTAASSFITFLSGKDKKLYVGTNNGLYLIEFSSDGKKKIRHYGITDGLINLETNLNSAYIEPSGKLWFGTASGLVSFQSKCNEYGYIKPLLVLEGLWYNFQRDTTGKYITKQDRMGRARQLVVPHSKNTITIEIDGIDLTGSGLTYQYWLEGLDQYWRPPNDNRTITFNDLPAGDYVLHIRSTNLKGISSEELKMQLTVNEAFYKTWWFIGLTLLLVGWIVWKIFRFRLQRELEKSEREKLEYSSRLLALEQKSLNASMNRHFIFNSLNSIQYYINTQDKLSANKFLTNFAKLIRKNLDSSEEGNLVTLQEEMERLQLYCSLEAMRFNNRFEFKIHLDPEIDPESIILPAMLLQPFIENSIIHGILPIEDRICHIDVSIQLEDQLLTITIDDDGMGVEESKAKKINKLDQHQSQGVEISLKRVELLQKLTGKAMSISGPFDRKSIDGRTSGTRVIVKIEL